MILRLFLVSANSYHHTKASTVSIYDCIIFKLFFFLLQDDGERITPFLGTWKGRSITKRSGVYGSTLSEADTVAVLDINDQGQVVQVYDYST